MSRSAKDWWPWSVQGQHGSQTGRVQTIHNEALGLLVATACNPCGLLATSLRTPACCSTTTAIHACITALSPALHPAHATLPHIREMRAPEGWQGSTKNLSCRKPSTKKGGTPCLNSGQAAARTLMEGML